VPSQPGTRPSRRAVLAGGLGLAAVAACGAGGYELVQNGTLPGRYRLARLTGACELTPAPLAGPLPSRHQVSFRSAYRRRDVQMVTLIPATAPSPAGLGVVIALHGSGGSPATLAPVLARAMSSARVTRFAIVCVDGGDTYWHKRADGDDPAGMIVHEVLPRAAAAGLRTGRIALLGESMGGYGALLLAERFAAAARPREAPEVGAVAALSPAIFASYADARAANRTSFDSQADFRRNDVLAGAAALRDVAAWIACGSDDPFEPETEDLRARLTGLTGRTVPGGILAGCHDDAFWARNMPTALRFAAAHLTGPAAR
jgi:pimeloyl-ACP methyl ester carboxylesterase